MVISDEGAVFCVDTTLAKVKAHVEWLKVIQNAFSFSDLIFHLSEVSVDIYKNSKNLNLLC
jgi:hypothetical protein